MWVRLAESPVLARVRELVAPIASDLGLDLYDVEQRGGTLRVTLDTPAGSPGGRHARRPGAGQPAGVPRARPPRPGARPLHARGHQPGRRAGAAHPRPLPARGRQGGRHPPGRRRPRRAPGHRHARRRRRHVGHRQRSICPDGPDERTVRYDQIDRAKTVFEWGPAPKPGRPGPSARRRRSTRREQPRHERSDPPARPGEGAVRGFPAARPRRCPGVGLQAPSRRGRRGRRRGRPGHDGVHVHSPTTSTRTATGSTSATTRPSATSSAASPPRRSAR